MRGGKVRKRDLGTILLPSKRESRKRPFLSSTRRDSGTWPRPRLQCVGCVCVGGGCSPPDTHRLPGQAWKDAWLSARTRGDKGPPEAQRGKPAQEHAGPGLEALGIGARALAPHLTPLGCSSEAGAPALGGGPVSADSHSGQGWELRGLSSQGPGVRGPRTATARALEPARRGRVRARPASPAAAAAAGEIAGC